MTGSDGMSGAPVGFIGLGNMGGRMTKRLVDAGVEVVGYDVAPGAVQAAGAREAGTISDLVATVDLVFLSLPDSSVVEAVVLGEGGIVEYARPGLVVVDLSTASPASTQAIHRRLEQAGVEFLDAGISGGAAAAARGTLTLMVGGSSQTLAAVTPLLDLLASRIFHMGGPGTGHSVKLLNNFLNAVNLAASAEVMVAARMAGLDVSQVLDVINSSSGANWATQNRFPSIVQGDYLEGGLTSQLMMKDVASYLSHLAELGAPSLNAAGPVASFGLALNRGYADLISNRVVDAIGDLAGGIRLYEDPPARTDGAPVRRERYGKEGEQ